MLKCYLDFRFQIPIQRPRSQFIQSLKLTQTRKATDQKQTITLPIEKKKKLGQEVESDGPTTSKNKNVVRDPQKTLDS